MGQSIRGEIFHLKDGYGEPVAVHEDDDLLYLNKNAFWRVAKDMFNAAQSRVGMDWPSIWQALTGERVEDVAINAIKPLWNCSIQVTSRLKREP